MRVINKIIVHCTGTPEGRNHTVEDIRAWHKAQGWKDIGYHFLVDIDGKEFEGRPIEQIGAHCSGYNADSIGIVYVGGMTKDMKAAKDTRTDKQKETLKAIIDRLKTKFQKANVFGHNDFNKGKACPSFDAKNEYK